MGHDGRCRGSGQRGRAEDRRARAAGKGRRAGKGMGHGGGARLKSGKQEAITCSVTGVTATTSMSTPRGKAACGVLEQPPRNKA